MNMINLPRVGPLAFKRIKVADQAAGVLREAIQAGELTGELPGEHELARALGISRPCLRAALAQLAGERLIVIRKGHHSRVSPRRRQGRGRSRPAVCVVCPVSPEALYFQDHPVLLEMHAEFARRGVRWEVVFEPRLSGTHPEGLLGPLVASRPDPCWILFAAPEPLHRWFAVRRLPTLVVGSCFPGIDLPAADTDYGAAGWHAAGVMVRHGHRRVAVVLPEQCLPGDTAARAGFHRHLAQHAPDVSVTDWSSPHDPGRRRAALDRLLTGPHRPTAVFTLGPALSFAAYLSAVSVGLRIPQDLSIIARDSHPFFDWTLPELTRYGSTATTLGRRAVRIVLRLLAGQNASTSPSLVMPAFLPGGTLAHWRERT